MDSWTVKNLTSKNVSENSRSQEIDCPSVHLFRSYHKQNSTSNSRNSRATATKGATTDKELNSHNLKAYSASKGAAAVEQLRDQGGKYSSELN